MPKIFYVNWFRKDENGKWLWPGFGDNIRVLKWIFERCEGTANAVKTQIGYLPDIESIDISGLENQGINLPLLLSVDKDKWREEIALIKENNNLCGGRFPGSDVTFDVPICFRIKELLPEQCCRQNS